MPLIIKLFLMQLFSLAALASLISVATHGEPWAVFASIVLVIFLAAAVSYVIERSIVAACKAERVVVEFDFEILKLKETVMDKQIEIDRLKKITNERIEAFAREKLKDVLKVTDNKN